QGSVRRDRRRLARLAVRVPFAQEGRRALGTRDDHGDAALRLPDERTVAHRVGAQHPRRRRAALLDHVPQFPWRAPKSGRLARLTALARAGSRWLALDRLMGRKYVCRMNRTAFFAAAVAGAMTLPALGTAQSQQSATRAADARFSVLETSIADLRS